MINLFTDFLQTDRNDWVNLSVFWSPRQLWQPLCYL